MAKFQYVATNSAGKKIKGALEADTEAKAYANLKTQGLTPVTLKQVSTTGMQMEIKIPGFEKGVKTADLAVFARQFAVLIRAGMPLVKSLQTVTAQTASPKLREALVKVLEDIERGAPLSTAMKKQEKVFPPLMTSLITVGESGGFLDKSLESVARTFKSELEMKARVKSAMTYPVIVGGVAILAVVGMLLFVVPVFQGIFEGLDAELPAPTQFLVTLSENIFVILPIALVLGGAGFFWYRQNKNKLEVRAKLDPLKMKIPVFGKLNAKVSIARFSRNLSMMLAAGVPLMSALELVGSSANNYVMEDALNQTRDGMASGRAFSDIIQQHTVFPPIVSQMIMIGEESGSLPGMLDSIADFYEDEIKEISESLASALEPIMIVGVGGLVGGMIIALYLPMFSMFGEM